MDHKQNHSKKKTYRAKRRDEVERMRQLLGNLQETQYSTKARAMQNVFSMDITLSLDRGRTYTNFDINIHPGLLKLLWNDRGEGIFKRGEDINDNSDVTVDLKRRSNNIDKYLRINKQGKPIGWSRATISSDQNNKHPHQLRHDIDRRIQPDYDTFQWASYGFNATSAIDTYLMPRLMPY